MLAKGKMWTGWTLGLKGKVQRPPHAHMLVFWVGFLNSNCRHYQENRCPFRTPTQTWSLGMIDLKERHTKLWIYQHLNTISPQQMLTYSLTALHIAWKSLIEIFTFKDILWTSSSNDSNHRQSHAETSEHPPEWMTCFQGMISRAMLRPIVSMIWS